MCYIPLLSVVCLFCMQPKKQMRNLHTWCGVEVSNVTVYFFGIVHFVHTNSNTTNTFTDLTCLNN